MKNRRYNITHTQNQLRWNSPFKGTLDTPSPKKNFALGIGSTDYTENYIANIFHFS